MSRRWQGANSAPARFKLNAEGYLPIADNLSIDGNFNLQQISDLLRNFNKLPKDTRLAGTAHIQASGSMDGQTLVLQNTRIAARNFKYRDGQKTLHEDRLTLQIKGKLNFKNKSAFLAPVNITASPGTITIPELTVRDWSDVQKRHENSGKGGPGPGQADPRLRDFIQLPEKTRISGKGKFDLDVDFSSPKAQFL